MKNVLLLIHDDDGQEARIQAALDLTRALSGHLTCLEVVRAAEFIGDYVGTAGSMIFDCEERDRASHNKAELEPRFRREGVSWSWDQDAGDIASIVGRRAGLADIIVLNTDLQDHMLRPDMRAITSQVVVESGTPILAVPERRKGFEPGARAMVAWDGSAPAINALQTATPILALAASVTIVEIDFDEDDAIMQVSAEDAAAYLSRYGVPSTIERRRTQGLVPIANLLLEAACDLKVGYAVLGAFGRSRALEAVFGGVSRAMLTRSEIPLILAH